MRVELTREIKVLLICVAISAGFITIGILSGDPGVMGNVIILSTFIMALPQLFFRYERFRAIKEIEETFPAFLRDLVESLRAGMPLHQAIRATSRFEYGRLSHEVRRMANQISWGVPVEKVLDRFAQRVSKSGRLYSSIQIIRESYLTGGDVASTLEAVADGSTVLEEIDKERRSILSQYVVIMYFITIIFVGIVIALNKFLVPIFEVPGGEMGLPGLINPCFECVDPECVRCEMRAGVAIPCMLYGSLVRDIFRKNHCSVAAYYTALFFFMAVIQSFFSGLVAGQIAEGSTVAGIKHSMILIGITFGTFNIAVRMGFLGI
jgi:flagellar protein FlaJ